MDFWNNRFKNEKYAYGIEPNVFFADTHRKLNLSGEALAIAEGEGHNAVFLAEQGISVTIWDYSAAELAKTEKLADIRGVAVKTKLVDLNDAKWEKDKSNCHCKLLNHLNISNEDAFGYGDSLNDLEMLEYVHHGVAMGNAMEAVKKVADDITDSIDEDGLYKSYKKYGLI